MPGYFLDTSALAKLYHPEIGSERMESLVHVPDTRLLISQLSLIEIQSVLATKVRTGVIDKATLDQSRGLFFSDLGVSKSFCWPAATFRMPRRSFEPTRWTMRYEHWMPCNCPWRLIFTVAGRPRISSLRTKNCATWQPSKG